MRIVVSVMLAAAAAACTACSPCIGESCAKQPTVRPIDHACLPAGAPRASVPMYHNITNRTFTEIAYVDSFASPDKSPDTVRQQMQDLQSKAGQAGADALIQVQQLANKRTGLVNNPQTPFDSKMQGSEEQYFFRGIAVKYGSQGGGVER